MRRRSQNRATDVVSGQHGVVTPQREDLCEEKISELTQRRNDEEKISETVIRRAALMEDLRKEQISDLAAWAMTSKRRSLRRWRHDVGQKRRSPKKVTDIVAGVL